MDVKFVSGSLKSLLQGRTDLFPQIAVEALSRYKNKAGIKSFETILADK